MGIDAIVKSRHDLEDFEAARPKHWGRVKLKDFLWRSRPDIEIGDLTETRKVETLQEGPINGFFSIADRHRGRTVHPVRQGRGLSRGLKPVPEPYKKRMRFVPNAVGLYLHRPKVAETLRQLNSKIMRDPSCILDQFLKQTAGGGLLRD
jgi:hypothetical protein